MLQNNNSRCHISFLTTASDVEQKCKSGQNQTKVGLPPTALTSIFYDGILIDFHIFVQVHASDFSCIEDNTTPLTCPIWTNHPIFQPNDTCTLVNLRANVSDNYLLAIRPIKPPHLHSHFLFPLLSPGPVICCQTFQINLDLTSLLRCHTEVQPTSTVKLSSSWGHEPDEVKSEAQVT